MSHMQLTTIESETVTSSEGDGILLSVHGPGATPSRYLASRP